jgi:HSP20 family molecular chaperone IbpA
MSCPKCGSAVEAVWEYCPKCGFRLKTTDMFSMVEKEADNIRKSLESSGHAQPFRQTPVTRGFSIKIVQNSGQRPKVTVNTIGDVGRKVVENETMNPGMGKGRLLEEGEHTSIEEPKTGIRCVGDRIIADIMLPGMSEEDVNVATLQSSVEVKAISGEKAYFKILTKPEKSRILKKSFSNGVLHLELG